MNHKIAVLVDSGCNPPPELMEKQGVYCVPLKINYPEGSFRDGLDIEPKAVYERIVHEIPTTSLPSMEEVLEKYQQIKADGYDQVMSVHISSNLSGTYNTARLAAEEMEGLDIRLIDTRNIGIGSGFLGLYAAQLIEKGLSLDEIAEKVQEKVASSRVFFCVDTLKYLQKGGRIGLVSSILGTTLNLKPIISCNPDGIYYTVAKVRGKKQAVEKMIELAKAEAAKAPAYDICPCHGGAYDEFDGFRQTVEEQFAPQHFYATEISPTLGVHTGPGLLGIGVFPRD